MIETCTIDANGLTFTASCAGPTDGEPVLLLHGFPNSRHSWDAQIRALSDAGCRGVAIDQRGYSPGARPADVADYGTSHMVSDAFAVAEAAGWGRFHLVGHDWGGQIAWLMAMAEPTRLRSLSILSRPHPAAFAHAMAEDLAQAARSGHHKRFQSLDMAARLLADDAAILRNTLAFEGAEGTFHTGGDGRKRRMTDDQVDAHLSVLGNREALEAALNWYRAAFQAQGGLATADAPAITVPTLYLWGDEDGTVGRVAAENTGRFVAADYSFRELTGAGHFLAEERPKEVNQAILAHIHAQSPDQE